MNLSSAWDSLVKENNILKLGLLAMGLSIVALTSLVIFYRDKDPLVIERGCYSKSIDTAKLSVTPDEIKTFLSLALEKRFNSETFNEEFYLSFEQRERRKSEQMEMKQRNILQTVIFRNFKTSGSELLIDADRLIALGEVRSAFPIKLVGRIEIVKRTVENPYGLLLVGLEIPKSAKDGDK
ncbi:MAG: hypothetical protein JNM24_04745 [Bdellovibrionaceae bacterium]|nr:hypothetical protein [Pseudobdellovibrionaceae bacterium]